MSLEPIRRGGAVRKRNLSGDKTNIKYDPRTSIAIGYGGVGWEDAEIYYQRYGKLSKEAVLNKVYKGLVF